ncbi:MAG TPA: MIP/aquaporin family protein [Saprospiraceae bacterium]|nr:MIP/aquaporin family protein [Saprospiraceae bacterium]HMP25553.1 MIP/aquaporin family protein [Saprospiraceae bacterium]
MNTFTAELIGTAILILLGNGVVANVVLQHSKGANSGWIVITFGWAIAVFVPVFMVGSYSGAHINPAVTLGFLLKGTVTAAEAGVYLAGQMLGAMLGSSLVWLHYRLHLAATPDPDLKRALFCTSPAIPHTFQNFISEVMGTFVLVLAVFFITGATVGDQAASLGALDALPVALVVLGIGLSLGGTTGYAINPARDLGPRIMHRLLPMPNKGSSEWHYAWIPVVGPLTGAALAALLHSVLVG